MDSIDTLQALQAARSGRAVRRVAYRHDHIESHPFVISGLHLAGDKGAVMALKWGVDRDLAELVVVPEPRDRDLRFERLARFAEALNSYLASVPPGCAPQVVFANTATANWLLELVGRFTRYRPQNNAVPDSIPEMGRALTLLWEQRRIPGNSVVLTMTEALGRHFVNGQTEAENANLYTQLGWIHPPAGIDGRQAALLAEDNYPTGPITDPQWDAEVLEPTMSTYRKAKNSSAADAAKAEERLGTRLREVIEPGWLATWEALDVLRELPPAAHVAVRWASDRARWEREAPKVFDGSRLFAIFPRATSSAILLETLEDAIQNLDFQMAIDDPLVLARHELAGRAISGTVTSVDLNAKELTGGKSKTRPTITLSCFDTVRPVIGTEMIFTQNATVKVRLIAKNGNEAILRVVAGALTRPTFSKLPEEHSTVAFCTLTPAQFSRGNGWGVVPWTHTIPVDETDAQAVTL